MATVELSSGRGQRERKPTEKAKDTSIKKKEVVEIADQLVPPKYKLPEHDVKWFDQPKAVQKYFDHTKRDRRTGETFDFYKLGPQSVHSDLPATYTLVMG